MAFKKGQGGRPKGAKNKSTVRKQTAHLGSTEAMAALALPSLGMSLGSGEAPTEAPPGISARDLMLANMRLAWKAAYAKSAEAEAIEAMASAATDSEAIESFRKTASELRLEAGRHLSIAQAAAKDVAPYLHPRLQATDNKVSGGLVIQIKQYPKP